MNLVKKIKNFNVLFFSFPHIDHWDIDYNINNYDTEIRQDYRRVY